MTTGNWRIILPFIFPATCARPLSHITSWTYSQPFLSNKGCTVAQPTSVFQNHRLVDGFAAFDYADTCGWYHSFSPDASTVSPLSPLTPYAPSEMIKSGEGQWLYAFETSPWNIQYCFSTVIFPSVIVYIIWCYRIFVNDIFLNCPPTPNGISHWPFIHLLIYYPRGVIMKRNPLFILILALTITISGCSKKDATIP